LSREVSHRAAVPTSRQAFDLGWAAAARPSRRGWARSPRQVWRRS